MLVDEPGRQGQARSVDVPLVGLGPEIAALDTEASIAECLEVAEGTRYSRFPLCEGGDLDRTLGVVHIKDFFRIIDDAKPDLVKIKRDILIVPDLYHVSDDRPVWDELRKLPGIGARSAERIAFHILKTPAAEALALIGFVLNFI